MPTDPDKAIQINDEATDTSRTIITGEEAVDADGRFVGVMVRAASSPTTGDNTHALGTVWLNTATNDVYRLVAKPGGVAAWNRFALLSHTHAESDVTGLVSDLAGKQPVDGTLTALAGLATGSNKIPYSTGTDVFGQLDFDADGTLAANSATRVPAQSAVKTYADTKQPLDATLTALASVLTAANKIPYATATDVAGELTLDTDVTLAANSDLRVASQKAIKAYADQLIAAADAMVFKGVINCSANPNYPAADAGWTYRVSVAGKIGGASGINVEIGDLLLCIADATASGNQATVGSSWNISQANIDGAVVGPTSATDSNFAQFDGTSGKLIKGGLSLDTDGTLAANSDTRVASQKAVKTYVDTQQLVSSASDPTTSDNSYVIGQLWLNTTSKSFFLLEAVVSSVATWIALDEVVRSTSDPGSTVKPVGVTWINTTTGSTWYSLGGGYWGSDSRQAIILVEDWNTGTVAGFNQQWVQTTGNGGTATWDATLQTAAIRGIVKHLVASGNVAGRSQTYILNTVPPFVMARGIGFVAKVYLDVLGDVTNPIRIRIGFGDVIVANSTTDQNNGFFFEYDYAVSANWLLRTAAASARTTVTGTIAVAAATWITLEARASLDNTKVNFYVNGAYAGQATLTLPTGTANTFFPYIGITRATVVGNASRSLYLDSYIANYIIP